MQMHTISSGLYWIVCLPRTVQLIFIYSSMPVQVIVNKRELTGKDLCYIAPNINIKNF
jgi:hypothetical protein